MKIMTATIALEKGNLNDVFVAGDEVLKMYGTNIYLEKRRGDEASRFTLWFVIKKWK